MNDTMITAVKRWRIVKKWKKRAVKEREEEQRSTALSGQSNELGTEKR
jgi:hypothetical protein